MVQREEIRAFVDRVVDRFRPAAVILLGSHARGAATQDSDVGLMVLMPHRGPSAAAATRIRLSCPRSFPLDLIVRTPAQYRSGVRQGDPFLREIQAMGIVLHETRNARLD